MTDAFAPPRDFDGLKALMIVRKPSLPRRLAQVAEFAVASPDELAFGTVASVAEMAGVQPSALIRFAKSLGYDGFSDLQAVFRSRLRDRWPDYDERLEELRKRPENDTHALFTEFCDTAIHSLRRLDDTVDPNELDKAVTILARARIIYLVAQRRAFPVAAYMAYALSKMRLATVLVDNVAGLGPEQTLAAGKEDAMVAISFTPYAPLTVDIANKAAERGVPIVAITDSAFSPLSHRAAARLDVVEADLGAFRSLSGTLCLAMALCVAAAEKKRG